MFYVVMKIYGRAKEFLATGVSVMQYEHKQYNLSVASYYLEKNNLINERQYEGHKSLPALT